MKVYRNVYLKSNLPKFSGKELLYYYGKIISNANLNNSLNSSFNRNEDIYLGCDCDSKKYIGIIKKSKNYQDKNNQKREIKSYGRKCKKC